jgi:hypothetical protein
MSNNYKKAVAVLLAALALPALAASSASSASSDSVSTSVGSISGSFEKSSESSTGDKKTAGGDYKVMDVAEAPNRPGMVRMRLQAVKEPGANGEFFLVMPQQAATDAKVGTGQVVTARLRPYGYEFAKADTQQPFFLVLADHWFRELQTKPVTL